MVNAHIEEVIEFRNKLMSEQDCSSQRISPVSSSFAYSISNDLSSEENNVKSIGQLAESIEVASYWVFATIIEIESDQDWWYLSCKRCSKKVNPVGKRFYCEKCDKFDFAGTPRFKVQDSDALSQLDYVDVVEVKACQILITEFPRLVARVEASEGRSHSQSIVPSLQINEAPGTDAPSEFDDEDIIRVAIQSRPHSKRLAKKRKTIMPPSPPLADDEIITAPSAADGVTIDDMPVTVEEIADDIEIVTVDKIVDSVVNDSMNPVELVSDSAASKMDTIHEEQQPTQR
ncbi:uncharacterized protein LOC120255268 [Dioscorea cayenensis subsp. rotundata]|uniref:Uncharacterized protein LOC120255268 n=1 Tax=Dioscorea cayennensis subsp. rotundata TaxID=55577 RepID=A0AB40AVN2_DIOCR|nr:uncharacterized protein LOC120255268 [Dioscorea cayenensis subsp. rotundata]